MVDRGGIDVVGYGLWWHSGSGVKFGGSGGLACVVDGGSVGFFFFWVLINCVEGGSIRFFFLFCVGFFFFDKLCWGFGSS